MALANICDRCGTVFKAEQDIMDFRYHIFDNEKDCSRMYNAYFGFRVGDMIDLCPKCYADLYTWVNTEVKRETD